MKAVLAILLIINIVFANTLLEDEQALEQKDYKKAFDIFKLLADKEDINAMYNLGAMYSNGVGINVDHIESDKWIDLSNKIAKSSFNDNIDSMKSSFINTYDISSSGKSGCSDASNSVDNLIKDTKIIVPCINAQTVSDNPSTVETEVASPYLIYGYGLVALVLIYVMF